MDEDKIPWTGGISNRQILIDTVRGIAVWAALFILLFLLLWWTGDFIPFIKPSLRGPISAGVAVALARLVTRWWRRT